MWIDVKGVDHEKIINRTYIERFTKTLVEKIDMVAYGRAIIHHFGTEEKKGYTLVQLIETSNITMHFAEDIDAIFIDVFSCKMFDADAVLTLVEEWFIPNVKDHDSYDLNWDFVERGDFRKIKAVNSPAPEKNFVVDRR